MYSTLESNPIRPQSYLRFLTYAKSFQKTRVSSPNPLKRQRLHVVFAGGPTLSWITLASTCRHASIRIVTSRPTPAKSLDWICWLRSENCCSSAFCRSGRGVVPSEPPLPPHLVCSATEPQMDSIFWILLSEHSNAGVSNSYVFLSAE